MTVSTFQQSNFSTQTVAAYPATLDGNTAVFTRIADAFAPHGQATPNMTVALDPGHLFANGVLIEVAPRAPVRSLPRHGPQD